MIARRYETPAAFKQAIEQRLRDASANGVDFARRRQLLVFDRFLARIDRVMGEAAILKGGLVLELRLDRARSTKDLDLRLVGPPQDVLGWLQDAGRINLGDFMTFEVQPDPEHPDIQNEGMHYAGKRHRVDAKLAGKPYGRSFGVDVAFADPILGEPDVITTRDMLGFAGIHPPTVRLYPIESHIAEKLHAYTLPRLRVNSRVKDLPDLALLASICRLDAARVQAAIELTFSFRRTHVVPDVVPASPSEWANAYLRMAVENDLPWRTLPDVIGATRAFLDPVLARRFRGTWSPAHWVWTTEAE